MRFIRYRFSDHPIRYGWINDKDQVGPIEGSIYGEFRRLNVEVPLDQVQLFSPVLPGKIICTERNFASYARQSGLEIPEVPQFFLKPSSAIIGAKQPIVLPPQSQEVEHEAELAVIIKKAGRWIPSEKVMDYILGFTIGNDITARDLVRRDGHLTRGKSFDTFCPLGPWIETDFDPADALITCHVNKEMRQMASTRDMIFTIRQLVTFFSSIMTLEPGDTLLTGTPAGVNVIHAGDTIEISIEGLGILVNPVVSSKII